MDTEKLNQISKKFLFTDSFLCYSSIFNPFIDYNEYYLQFYLARGVRFNFDFAKKIYKYYDIESENVLRSIAASYIMNNVIDVDLLSKHIPYNFWYPKSPNKDTCVKLLDIDKKYHVYVAILCILNKWTDILLLCKFRNKDMLLKELDKCIEINYSLNSNFFNNFDLFLEDDLFSFLFYDGYSGGCCNFKEESYLEFLEEEVDRNDSNDICFVNASSIENIIYKNNFIIPYFDFKLEDIKYNFSLAHYILSNHTTFTSKECSYALSVYISCGILDHELISLYGVFYLFSYKVPKLSFLIKLYNECSFLKYNIAVVLCVYNSPSRLYDKLDLLPDLDIYSIAQFYNNEHIKQDMLNKNKLHNKWYRHLDFKNSKNITPIEVTFKDKICYGNLLTTSCFS